MGDLFLSSRSSVSIGKLWPEVLPRKKNKFLKINQTWSVVCIYIALSLFHQVKKLSVIKGWMKVSICQKSNFVKLFITSIQVEFRKRFFSCNKKKLLVDTDKYVCMFLKMWRHLPSPMGQPLRTYSWKCLHNYVKSHRLMDLNSQAEMLIVISRMHH